MPRDPARSQPRWTQAREMPRHPHTSDDAPDPSHVSYGHAQSRPRTTRPRFRNIYRDPR